MKHDIRDDLIVADQAAVDAAVFIEGDQKAAFTRYKAGNSVFLLVYASGVKSWQFIRKVEGKQVQRILGPAAGLGRLTLKQAMKKRNEVAVTGVAPVDTRRAAIDIERKVKAERKAAKDQEQAQSAAKAQAAARQALTYSKVFEGWYRQYTQVSAPVYRDIGSWFRTYVLSKVGDVCAHDVTHVQLLDQVLKPAFAACPVSTGSMFHWWMKMERWGNKYHGIPLVVYTLGDDMTDLRKTREGKKRHHPHIPLVRAAKLLQDIWAQPPNDPRTIAFKWLVYTAKRPGRETCELHWDWLDLDNAIARIPPGVMKEKKSDDADDYSMSNADQVHEVPLPHQLVAILREWKKVCRSDRWVFPAVFGNGCLNGDMLSIKLREMGYAGRQTPHGFRHAMSGHANDACPYTRMAVENDFAPKLDDVIEKNLDHMPADAVRATYNGARYMEPRRAVAQWYADAADKVRAGNVVSIKQAA